MNANKPPKQDIPTHMHYIYILTMIMSSLCQVYVKFKSSLCQVYEQLTGMIILEKKLLP